MAKLIRNYSMGRTRKELVDYVLNCTEEELFDLCSVINEQIKGITTWSCEECEKRFGFDCDSGDGMEMCLKHFSEMNQPFYE